MKEKRKEIGKEFRRLRELNGLSQTEVADILGVTYQTIGRVENGIYSYNLDLYLRLKDFYESQN